MSGIADMPVEEVTWVCSACKTEHTTPLPPEDAEIGWNPSLDVLYDEWIRGHTAGFHDVRGRVIDLLNDLIREIPDAD